MTTEDSNNASITTSSIVIDQFSRQAAGYAASATIRNDGLLERMVNLIAPGPADEFLDVACGPGLVVCAFAPHVRSATGIDLTPAMLAEAFLVQAERRLTNVSWIKGDVARLPFADDAFSIVTSRYAFHHFVDPGRVLSEMARVTRPGGTILIVDSAPAPEKAKAFNFLECLRDNSHQKALTPGEFGVLFATAGLVLSHVEHFRLAGDLDSLLSRSFPLEGDEERIRAMLVSALDEDFLDVQPRRVDGKIAYGFPIGIFKLVKPEN
ncbi:MAG: methyltransferase domain-containing protein [Terracidiphilus sp.]